MLTESIHEINSSIAQLQHDLAVLSRSNPHRPLKLLILALTRLDRHIQSTQKEDLDKAILHLTESILLLPLSWLELGPHSSLILDTLFYFADALSKRSEVSNQPDDAIYSAKFLHHLRDQPHEMLHVPRHQITKSLVCALAMQVELETGDVMENIQEIAVCCGELLILETSDVDITDLIILIHELVSSHIGVGVRDGPLDELIKFLRAARKHRPDLLRGRLALAKCLAIRFHKTLLDDDYEEAVSILDKIITSSSPGDSRDVSVDAAHSRATVLVTVLAWVRSRAHETPEHLEEAIYRSRAFLSSSSATGRSAYITSTLDPKHTAEQRFRYFGSIEGVEASSDNSLSSQLVQLMPEFGETVDKMNTLLFGIRNADDTTKIDESIEKGRAILASHPPTDPIEVYILNLFCDTLDEAFERTNKIKYLNESISTRRQIIDDLVTPAAYSLRFLILPLLSRSLFNRFLFFSGQHNQDLDESLELLSQSTRDVHARFPDRFHCACLRAFIAQFTRHHTISTAYKTAMSLMQDTLHFSPTLQLQHTTLATRGISHTLPLDYASHQVDLGQLEEAIETLERGRALLWSEMRHFRTSIDQLLEADPDLGHKFAAVNRDLEELTKSVAPSHKLSMEASDSAADNLRAVDPFGRLVVKQRRLSKERDDLISQIQALPGFDSFLTSPSFNTLRSAAESGPVIIINHSVWRSDILILLHSASPSLIPTPNDFYDRAGSLTDKLSDSRRKYGLDSIHYDETLASVLAELYTLVGQPIIHRLRQLQVPEQSRIWWCPTSVFCSLPLHAMGPIPSNVGEPRYFLDLYICSYTPTLSALIQSRNRHSGLRSSGRPSILLVAQPDPSLPTVGGEIQVVQALDTEVTSLISEAATPTTVINGFRHHGFVHFACHGTLEANKPFEAGFELHGGERLTLLEIVRSHLPTAEFAFLSACHTAELTDGSVMDEGLHLAAAVQYCGFRSVVGTMWAMVDEDGRDLAAHFYKALFSNPRGMPYHERSAKALRFAVKKLRRKRRITLERWVNFVHYGA